jgi:hypothetical protein
MTFYRIKSLGTKIAKLSMTEPVRGTLDAILKQDSDNSPCCVYNETTALRLAQRLGIPLAMGVPSVGDGGVYFASLVVGGLSINLPDISEKRMSYVAKRYPDEAAAIFVFDTWILNNDRTHNLKANLTSSPVHLVAAIDHEQTLLGHYSDPANSLQALQNLEVPSNHPLQPHVSDTHVAKWVAQTQDLSDEIINDSVILGYSLGGVHQRTQKKLAAALKLRRDALPELVEQVMT